MHDASIVVGAIQVIGFFKSVFVEIVLMGLFDVVPIDGHVIVPISARLFVPKPCFESVREIWEVLNRYNNGLTMVQILQRLVTAKGRESGKGCERK